MIRSFIVNMLAVVVCLLAGTYWLCATALALLFGAIFGVLMAIAGIAMRLSNAFRRVWAALVSPRLSAHR